MVRVLTVAVTGPLEVYANGFAQALLAQGFSRLSAANQLRVLAHVSRWLSQRRLRTKDFTEERAGEFLRARHAAGYTGWRSRRGLERIFEYLRALRVVPLPHCPCGPQERLIARYVSYLSQERGLAQTTIARRTDCARRFLGEFGTTRAALRSVRPPDVRDFIRTVSPVYSPRSLAGFGSDLRSFFRFLLVKDIVRRALGEAVPVAPGWRHDAIPSGISASEVLRLMASCDRRTTIGRRDYAVLILLTRLGLRAGEVLSLAIDDIDWRRGEIVVHGKGSKRERLPLPEDVGEALSGYLRHRPHATERRVFLRIPPPSGQPPKRRDNALGVVYGTKEAQEIQS